MRYLAFMLCILLPLPALAGGVDPPRMSRAAADGFYVNIDGDTMTGTLLVPALTLSGDFVTTTGIINSTVAAGTVGFLFDIVNAHTSVNLFEIWEEGNVLHFFVSHSGTSTMTSATVTGNLNVQNRISNTSATNGCTASGAANGAVCNLDDSVLDGYPYVEEMTAATPETGYWGLHVVPNSDVLTFTVGGNEHVIGGQAAYSSMWFHGAAVTTTIATEDTLVKITHFANNGIESNLVSDTASDDITVPAGFAGDYTITVEASVTPTTGNNQEILIIPAITLATPLVITDATNTTPIIVTSIAHGLLNGDSVQIVGVGGNTAANGNFTVSEKTVDTFELDDLDHVDVGGGGAYTSGGTVTIIYMGAATIETQVSSTDLSRATSSGTHALAVGDTISAYVANNSTANNIDFEQINLSVVRISD